MARQIKETNYSHEILWRAATRLFEKAKLNEDGSYYYRLTALLIFYLAYEGFINFIGHAILPDLWAKEREVFKGMGVEGKVSRIVESFDEFEWIKGEGPYQLIKKLEDFRHLAVHAHPVISDYITEEKDDKTHIRWDFYWDKFIPDCEEVEKYMEAIKKFCESLRVNAEKICGDNPQLIFPAFEGPLGWSEGQGI